MLCSVCIKIEENFSEIKQNRISDNPNNKEKERKKEVEETNRLNSKISYDKKEIKQFYLNKTIFLFFFFFFEIFFFKNVKIKCKMINLEFKKGVDSIY